MSFLSLIDISAVMVNSVATGLLSILQISYCSAPTLHIAIGSFGVSIWCATCACATILAFNRFIDTTNKSLYYKLFEGRRTYLWFILPIIYFLFFLIFTSPLIFSQHYMSWFFNPYQDYIESPIYNRTTDYSNIPHTVNNILIIILMVIGYGAMFSGIYKKSHEANVSPTTNGVLVKVQIQVFVICFFVFAAALLYVYMQFFVIPPFFTIVSQFLWSFAQGCGGVIYVTLNPTIRKAIVKLFCMRNKRNQVAQGTSRREVIVTDKGTTPIRI
uniref:Serpentine Receptor, class T n=1 Tax=Parastrongyloides trichosuri TaxID=131310 RepID=A0A0N4Z5E2_PARTI